MAKTMDIKLSLTQKGQIALTCHGGGFRHIVEGVELDFLTTMMTVRFEGLSEPVQLACPVHEETVSCVLGQQLCAIGYYRESRLIGAFFVPFEVTNCPQQSGFRGSVQ